MKGCCLIMVNDRKIICHSVIIHSLQLYDSLFKAELYWILGSRLSVAVQVMLQLYDSLQSAVFAHDKVAQL